MTCGMGIALALGVAASVEDLRRRQVPNWLTVAGLTGGLAGAACAGWHALGLAAAGAAVGFLVMLPLHRLGALGGGDVKLMAAFGSLLGAPAILTAAVFGAIFGGLCAAGARICNPRVRAIPYAPAIVLGAWFSLLGGGG